MASACALAIISGKIILNFGFQESLRTFLKPIFTGRVVEGNSICSAAFCESAALRLVSSPSQSNPADLPAPPKWEPLAVHTDFIFLPRPLPLGEVAVSEAN